MSSPPGADTFRAIAENALKATKGWDRYDESRRVVSESLAVRALERALGSPAFATDLHYYAPTKGTPVDALNRDCAEPSAIGHQVESDALFVIGDVAICLEVKGRSVADAARRGDVSRLRTEIKNILGHGTRQAGVSRRSSKPTGACGATMGRGSSSATSVRSGRWLPASITSAP